ncbi:HTH-type transcriptional activator RhaR [Escherichia coli]|uniref:HTH-type transcriptional activator RhaR n=1 Tax=Escherichia coli TaxID=562 RepID=UPI00388EA28E
MVFCNNANLLNVFVRHIANNQLRSLAEVATVAHQLKLLKDDFLPATSRQSLWLTVIRKMSLPNIHMILCELVIVWRGNGLHVLNDRPYRITRGDLFYIHADDKHSYASVNDLVLQNIIYCPERLKLNLDWQGAIPGFSASAGQPHWRLGSVGMAQARQVIGQLEHESSQHVSFANEMAELLFGQLVMLLNRHRYTSDSLPPTSSETLLDKLITRLAASLKSPFALDKFCDEASCSERVLRQQFRQQTGMTINQYLRQVRVCHAQYLLQHSRLLISDISTECGFEDSNYFSVVFTRETGMTPSQWRHLNSQKD